MSHSFDEQLSVLFIQLQQCATEVHKNKTGRERVASHPVLNIRTAHRPVKPMEIARCGIMCEPLERRGQAWLRD